MHEKAAGRSAMLLGVTCLLGIPEHLRPYCDGAASVELDGATVGAILGDLARRFPRAKSRVLDESGVLHPHLVVIRNDCVVARRGSSELRLCRGDVLRLYAAVSGG